MSQSATLRSVAEEDRLRADIYGFLGKHLFASPSLADIDQIAELRGDDTEFGRAFENLAAIATGSDPATLRDEYDALFIGVGRGELVPYGSYYLTGFLNEKPLARLRATMARLGIARSTDVKEPEDHIATLMQMMAGLIRGDYGAPADHATQRQMFQDHIAPWASHFYADLTKAKNARFYKPLGQIGGLFMGIESAAFDMD